MTVNKTTLRRLELFNRMDDAILAPLAELGKTISMERGESIYNSMDNEFVYYLLEGKVRLADDQKRQLHITAKTPLGRYPFGPHFAISRNAWIESAQAELVRFNRNLVYTLTLQLLSPLHKLSEHNLQYLVQRGEFLHLSRDTEIYSTGSQDNHIYYLLYGRVRMTYSNGKVTLLTTDEYQSHFAFGIMKPRPAKAEVDSQQALIACFDSKVIDTFVTWHDMVGQEEHIEPGHSNISALGVEKDDEDDPSEEKKRSDNEWLMTLLRSNTFYRIPLGNVQLLLEKMESMSVPAGKVIIRQDDPGDYYYLVREGQCEVLHNGVVIGHRKANEGFGEEALISGNPRNATVRMTEDGILVRLSKKDFNELLVPPLINHVSIAECIKMAEKGAILIDVRSRKEFKNQRLARSINLPLNILRVKISKLTPNKHKQFIVYCDTGARSSAACFLLKQEGFNAYLLDSPEEAFKTIWAPPSKESE